jgi:katanin p60 ATPase-containing subunit A1
MGRRDAAGEHEGSRRMKTELLIQMDGLSKSDDLVFVLAASNLPWDLDIALLRRLEKRILVPLPNERARLTMIKGHLAEGERALGLDYAELAKRTEGYSGSDIALLCKEAAMRPVRRLMKQLLTLENEEKEVDAEVKLDPVTVTDVKQALACKFDGETRNRSVENTTLIPWLRLFVCMLSSGTRPSAQSKFLEKYGRVKSE